jgi:2,4-dienoyl-CoA reductase-like NADH-dependent reductase (Old Yellow Enzyme family)
MYSSTDGFFNDFHVGHYASLALRGPGMIIIEATAVEPRGRISPNDAGLWSDDHIAPLKRVVDVIKVSVYSLIEFFHCY